MLRFRIVAGVAVVLSALAGFCVAQISPEASIKTFKVADGLECTLFAAEPMLVNPCDIDVDAQGRVWVCEGANYRKWANPPMRPGGGGVGISGGNRGEWEGE